MGPQAQPELPELMVPQVLPEQMVRTVPMELLEPRVQQV